MTNIEFELKESEISYNGTIYEIMSNLQNFPKTKSKTKCRKKLPKVITVHIKRDFFFLVFHTHASALTYVYMCYYVVVVFLFLFIYSVSAEWNQCTFMTK